MNDQRRNGLILTLIGAALCGWQVYELTNTKHLTFWVIGIFPIPVLLPGIVCLFLGFVGFAASFLPPPKPRAHAAPVKPASPKGEFLFLLILTLTVVGVGTFAVSPGPWQVSLFWLSALPAWLAFSALCDAMFGAECPSCGKPTRDAKAGYCGGCGELIPRLLPITALLSVTAILGSIFWSPAIPQPTVQFVIRWGLAVWGTLGLLRIIATAILSKRPLQRETVVMAGAVLVLLATYWLRPDLISRGHLPWLAFIPGWVLVDRLLHWRTRMECFSCKQPYRAGKNFHCAKCGSFFWPSYLIWTGWGAFYISTALFWRPLMTVELLQVGAVLGGLYGVFIVFNLIRAPFGTR